MVSARGSPSTMAIRTSYPLAAALVCAASSDNPTSAALTASLSGSVVGGGSGGEVPASAAVAVSSGESVAALAEPSRRLLHHSTRTRPVLTLRGLRPASTATHLPARLLSFQRSSFLHSTPYRPVGATHTLPRRATSRVWATNKSDLRSLRVLRQSTFGAYLCTGSYEAIAQFRLVTSEAPSRWSA